MVNKLIAKALEKEVMLLMMLMHASSGILQWRWWCCIADDSENGDDDGHRKIVDVTILSRLRPLQPDLDAIPSTFKTGALNIYYSIIIFRGHVVALAPFFRVVSSTTLCICYVCPLCAARVCIDVPCLLFCAII